MRRRDFLATGLKVTGAVCGAAAGMFQGSSSGPMLAQGSGAGRRGRQRFVEAESGDPDAPAEYLRLETGQLRRLETLSDKSASRGERKNPREVGEATLRIARNYIGVSRTSDPEQVGTFLALFGLGLRYGRGGPYVPYCAAGASFVACQAYCESRVKQDYDPQQPNVVFRDVLKDINNYYFKPHPACRVMVGDAVKRGNWVGRDEIVSTTPSPGWLVFFDWERDGVPNHVGIVERRDGDALHTVEFNTSITSGGNQSNGGAVSDKVRSLRHVLGYIRTY